ncbi:MAG: transglutaminase domain-containing protein [Prochloraceae cyanobacterium]
MQDKNSQNQLEIRTIRPIAACSLRGIAFKTNKLLAIDSINGYLLEIDPLTDNTKILNNHNWSEFVGATDLDLVDDLLWYASGDSIYYCSFKAGIFGKTELFVRLSDPIDGVAVKDSTVYATSQRSGKILVFDRDTANKITHFYTPGIGNETITVKEEEIWLADHIEQTVYCLDRATGATIFSVLTPYESPTGLAFYGDRAAELTLYVAYADREAYIRDNPNVETEKELLYRDRTFVHPLYFKYYPEKKYALSNGYLIEMIYTEEISPLDPVEIEDLEWRIALPAETPRQKIRKIEPVGLPFTEEIQNGQRVAVFKFDRFDSRDRYIFGWKALLEVWSIKYQIAPRDCENLPRLSPEFQQQYLEDNDNLAMNTDIILRAASEATGSETNLLRKMYSIRNYVYDRLSYAIKPHIDTPDLVLRRGVGSCGEYLGVLLALARLNGIPSRTVGRYKCPLTPDRQNIPLQPDFNHVWMEFYLPGFGWLPMESNPDDLYEGGPYPTRFFMGLAWYHAEVAKDISFESLASKGEPLTKSTISFGDLAINHVRFKIVSELIPGT